MSKMMPQSSMLALLLHIMLSKIRQLHMMLRKTNSHKKKDNFNKMMSMCGIDIVSKMMGKI